MKATLLMAVTPNGAIAKLNHDVSFVSKSSWRNYIRTANRAGNVIVGRTTYGLMLQGTDFDKMKGVTAVVVTRHPARQKPRKNTFFAASPKQAITLLKKKGFKQALVIGGGKLNASFLAAGLIDEIILDVMPAVLGEGIPLFAPGDYHAKLKLISVKKTARNEVQVRYRVLRAKRRE